MIHAVVVVVRWPRPTQGILMPSVPPTRFTRGKAFRATAGWGSLWVESTIRQPNHLFQTQSQAFLLAPIRSGCSAMLHLLGLAAPVGTNERQHKPRRSLNYAALPRWSATLTPFLLLASVTRLFFAAQWGAPSSGRLQPVQDAPPRSGITGVASHPETSIANDPTHPATSSQDRTDRPQPQWQREKEEEDNSIFFLPHRESNTVLPVPSPRLTEWAITEPLTWEGIHAKMTQSDIFCIFLIMALKWPNVNIHKCAILLLKDLIEP